MKICIPVVIVITTLLSCSSDESNTSVSGEAPVSTSAPVTTVTNNQPAATANTQTTSTIGQIALNPEHGKPGHRCDIAVGAPLNSQPTNPPNITTAPPVTNTNPISVTPGNTNTNATASGLNPQHGQPGHRCDIAVGAPLNSKPQQ